MIKEAISRVVEGRDLIQEEAEAVMGEIMRGEATPAQITALVIALRMKGETPEEIAGFAQSMRAHAMRVEVPFPDLVDTCGTGGDESGTFNISTIVAVVAAGAGLKVAKHGNRAVSSRCGSADLLEALGVKIDLGPKGVARCIREAGIGFLFAPRLHPAMKHAAAPRREIGVRTIFNLLGPLTNPAGASIQLLGVYSQALTETAAQVLRLLGTRRAAVVHGADGLDELSPTGVNFVTELKDGELNSFTLDPLYHGIPRVKVSDLIGGTVAGNVAIARQLLEGERGPRRNAVLLNAALLFTITGKSATLDRGLRLAAEVVDSGKAKEALERLVEVSQSCPSDE